MKHRAVNPKRSIVVAKLPWLTMKFEDMLGLAPLIKAAFKGESFLLLWSTGPLVKANIEIMEAWGYKFQTRVFTWAELAPNFGWLFDELIKTHINMKVDESELATALEKLFTERYGPFANRTTANILLGRRGKEPRMVVNKRQPELIFAPYYEAHSKINWRIEHLLRRPQDEMYELFTTVPTPGWKIAPEETVTEFLTEIIESRKKKNV